MPLPIRKTCFISPGFPLPQMSYNFRMSFSVFPRNSFIFLVTENNFLVLLLLPPSSYFETSSRAKEMFSLLISFFYSASSIFFPISSKWDVILLDMKMLGGLILKLISSATVEQAFWYWNFHLSNTCHRALFASMCCRFLSNILEFIGQLEFFDFSLTPLTAPFESLSTSN